MTYNIGILTACDSERHLSKPVFNKLKMLGMNPSYIYLTQNNITESYRTVNYYLTTFLYDFILAVGDRSEQVGGVLAAFQNKIPIGHLYSGDLDTGVSDDIHRAAITLYSSIQFCSSESAVINTHEIMRHAGLESNPYYVGATHFDELNIEEIKTTKHDVKPYILILINQETLSKPEYGDSDILVEKAVSEAIKLSTDNLYNFIIAKGNNDDEEIETKIFNELNLCVSIYTDGGIHIERNNRKDHKFFLSLIANCEYLITNSSSAIYEAPLLLNCDKIIHIGNRNKNRTPVPRTAHDGHASERVAKLIKEFIE